jgi:hypothetical protein
LHSWLDLKREPNRSKTLQEQNRECQLEICDSGLQCNELLFLIKAGKEL